MAPHDWAELQEPAALPLWEAILTEAAVGPGTRLLDAGCGAGGASRLAAGWGAWVNGIDAAPGLLAIARERVPDADFHLGDLETLPYADGTFNAIIAADVLPYMADPLTALRELRRVCAPRGRVVVAVWGAPEECAQAAVMATVRSLLSRPLDGDPFALSAPGALDALVAQAALSACGRGTVACPHAYTDLEMAWQAQVSTGPLQGALRVVGEHALKKEVLAALVPYRTATGGIRMAGHFRYIAAVPVEDHPHGRP
jgi:SAM-dependent methyltransferase